ncbi:MAG: transposase [Pseudomonadota bacterium]
MPLLIDPGAGDAFGLDDLVEALDAADFDVRDDASFAALGPLLARLGRNKSFLADLAIDELKQRCTGQRARNSYGAQVFLLRPAKGRYVLRANFWPARGDAVLDASGSAPFFYDLPHDHNFPFLTYGYFGPGYWSDYYEHDDSVLGLPGEAAGLRFTGRKRLDPDLLWLYRAHRDVHVQLPPDSFSVSLNILGHDTAQAWRSQYRFDVERGTVAEALTVTPSEALVALSVHLGGGNGVDLAMHLAASHPVPRMRATAIDALVSAGDRSPLERAVDDADPYVAARARRAIERLSQGIGP